MTDSNAYPYLEEQTTASVASSNDGQKATIQAQTASRSSARQSKKSEAFLTIREVADQLGLQQHVLRFWETKFSQIKPLKRGGGRRYYRPNDVILLQNIQHLLHTEGYTIKGVQKLLKSEGKKALSTELLSEQGSLFVSNSDDNEDVAVETLSEVKQISEEESNLRALLEELKILRDIVARS